MSDAAQVEALAEVRAWIEQTYAEHGHHDDWNVPVIYIDALAPHLAALVAAREDAARAEAWEARDRATPQYLGPRGGHYDDCGGWEDCYCATYPNPYRAALPEREGSEG